MTRTELLSSSTLTPAVVTAPGPNTLHVGRAVWDMLCEGRDERRWVYSPARRAGKTFAMQGVKFEIAGEGGVYVDVTDYAAEGTRLHEERQTFLDMDLSLIEPRVLAVYGMPDWAKLA